MKRWIERVRAATVKEFREFFRSRLLLFLAFASPLLMYLLFSYGFTLDVKDIPFSYLDQDHTPASRALVDSFANNRYFILEGQRNSEEEIQRDMLFNRVRFAFIIPPDFSRTLAAGKTVALQVLINGTMANRANITKGYVEGMIADYNGRLVADYLVKNGGAAAQPVDMLPVARFNPTLDSTNVLVPGIIGLVLFIYPAVLSALSLSRERESGMILNFYTSPLTRFQYILGKMLPLLAVSFANFIIFFIFTRLAFRVPFGGSFTLLIFASIIYLAASLGVGFLVAALVRSQVAALLITTIVTFLPGFLYSGMMVPVESMGEEGKMAATILPTYYYIKICKGLFLKDLGPDLLAGELLGLVAVTVALYSAVLMLLRKKL